jgi:release factor glutamine methyltransferase
MVLLADIMNKPKEWLLTHPEGELDSIEMRSYQAAVDRVRQGIPVAYVLGWREFYGRRFEVSPSTLIPRPETELLVEQTILRFQHLQVPIKILDLGTGSGCIGITLALEISNAIVFASDISLDALRVARCNARRFNVGERFHLVQSDLLNPFIRDFELICGNLPYIPSGELGRLQVAKWEPRQALDGGKNGIERTLEAIHQVPLALKPGGVAIFEIGAGQAEDLTQAVTSELRKANVSTLFDLSGIDRVLVIELPG